MSLLPREGVKEDAELAQEVQEHIHRSRGRIAVCFGEASKLAVIYPRFFEGKSDEELVMMAAKRAF